MPRNGIGFGMDSFGVAPFGEAWWSNRILWENMPEFDRNLDETVGEGALQKFMLVMGDMLNQPRREVHKYEFLRDARFARNKWVEEVELDSPVFTYVSEEDSTDGRSYVIATVPDGSALAAVGPEWLIDDGVSQWPIRSIRKTDNEIEFYTQSVPTLTVTARPTSMLEHLGADYGVLVDGHEPDRNQRSSVYDYHKLLDLKGTKKGIELRAEMAGFEARVLSLYRVTSADVELIVGSDHFFEIPDASGQFYTDVAPSVPVYDAVPADMMPTDQITACDSTTAPGVVRYTSGGSAGEWQVLFLSDSSQYRSGLWYFTYDSDTSDEPVRYYVNPEVPATTDKHAVIATQTMPVAGDVTWKLYCPVVTSCDWCKSYKLRIELEILDPALLSSPRALEAAFQRMKRKIEAVLPAHVLVVQYVFSTTHTPVLAEFLTSSLSYTEQYTLFDQTAADVSATDQFTITSH